MKHLLTTRLPALVHRIVHADHDFVKAGQIHRRLYPMFKAIFIEPNPVPIKVALARAGIISSAAVRLPLCEMSPANLTVLVKALAAARR